MMKKLLIFLTSLLVVITTVSAQSQAVKGVVLESSNGQPIIGATVTVKGTTIATGTDINGAFQLNAPSSSNTLVVSFIGMISQEVPVSANVRVLLLEDKQVLDDVIVVAYGTQRKEAITGAVANIKSEAIERRPIASATAALEGQALGVQVNNSYGEPGAESSIRIRGFNSINGTNSPLYIVDGVPMGGNVGDINPADIASISVLKDASSAALYGNRAANGVILITTKSGRIGEENLSVQLSTSHGVSMRGVKEYKQMNPAQYMEAYWQSRRNALFTDDQSSKNPQYKTWSDANKDVIPVVSSGIGEKYNIFNKSWDTLFDENGRLASGTEILPGYRDDLDWFEGLERTGYRSDYVLSASGGSKKATYYASIGYLKEDGFMKKAKGERFTGSAKMDFAPVSWFKAGIKLGGSRQIYNKMSGDTGSSNSYINPFNFARGIAPIYPVHKHDPATGEYILEAGGPIYDKGEERQQSSNRHIMWETDLNKDVSTRNTFDGSAYATITFLKDFSFTLLGNLNNRNSLNKGYTNSVVGDGSGQGRMSQTGNEYKNYLVQEMLNWNHTFNAVHNVEAFLAHEFTATNRQYTYIYKTQEKLPNIMELTNFNTLSSANGYQIGNKAEGYLGSAKYNYDQKYFAEFAFRRDGSSRFYKDNRWGNFWSVGASWLVSREEFMKRFEWIDYLKLRAAYGETGQDAGVGEYAWMGLYNSTTNGNLGAYYKSQLLTQDISWENSRSLSIGIESSFLKRINFSIEYFDKTSEDLLFDLTLPLSMGTTYITGGTRPTITTNFGSVANKGVEIGLDVDIIQNRDWTWNVGTNLNFLKNEVRKLPKEYGEKGYASGSSRYLKGHSIYEFWLYQFAGVDQSDGRSLYKLDDEIYYVKGVSGETENRVAVEEGEYTVIDDVPYVYKSSYAKKDWSGDAIPNLFGSLSTSLRYKSFQLQGLLTFQTGGKMLDYAYTSLMGVGATPGAVHKDMLNAWTPEKAGTGIDPKGVPGMNSSQQSDNFMTSNRWLISSDYLNIKNITLSYDVPRSIISPLGLSSAMITASGENLAYFTKNQGSNPQQRFDGRFYNAYVHARVITFGLSVKF